MARFFTLDYVERAVLRDGTAVLLRLIAPEDKALLRRGFERWSPESRYARFLVPKQRLSDDELRYLCEIDHETHFALGAIAEAGDGHGEPHGLGIARFIRLGDEPPPTEEPSGQGAADPRFAADRRAIDRPRVPITAEAAIAVADEAHGKGLGRLLFLRLCAAAAERGIEHFRCEVLCSNHSMQRLVDAIAPEHTIAVGGGVTTIDFAITPVSPDAPPTTEVEGPMYRFFRAAAEGAVEWTDAVRKFWRG